MRKSEKPTPRVLFPVVRLSPDDSSYDGPRQSLANYQCKPHFYDRVFDQKDDEYSDLYRLTPIDQQILELAVEVMFQPIGKPTQPVLPRRSWGAHLKRTGSQLCDHLQGYQTSDESSQSVMGRQLRSPPRSTLN